MTTGPTPRSPWTALELAGDEAILPAGVRLADEDTPGRQCFALIEGAATIEAAGRRIGELAAGEFVGSVDELGRPLPPDGITVRLASRSRVLVIDATRLAALIDSDPAASAAWHLISGAVRSLPRH
jgi:CRP-like cAMP-binding protein